MAKFLNAARFTPTLGGTTDWTVSAAVVGYQTPAAAGATDGVNYRYRAESADLTQWEIGYGASSSTGTVFARTTVLYNSSGTTSKINFSSAPTVGIVPLSIDFREKLDAARTYYVRTDGSNSNNGFANTAGGAFLTIQKAVDTIAGLDINAQTVTIQVADGTYTGSTSLKNVTGFAAAGNLVIQGNNATPANVVISTTSSNAFNADGLSVTWDIKDMKIQTTTSGDCIVAKNGSTVRWGNTNFGACAGSHLNALNGGRLQILSSYAISGSALIHWKATDVGTIIAYSGYTITLTGTPAWTTAFAYCYQLSDITCWSDTFSGAATGKRYEVATNGVIFTNGGGATYLPGGTAGTTATGGQYA